MASTARISKKRKFVADGVLFAEVRTACFFLRLMEGIVRGEGALVPPPR
jgi:hypothetical protein